MTTFDERERGFENRYAHDADLRFRMLARRNYKLGLWAAGRLGHEGAKAEEEARALVDFAVASEGDAAVVTHLVEAFERGRVPTSREDVTAKMATFLAEAQREVQGA